VTTLSVFHDAPAEHAFDYRYFHEEEAEREKKKKRGPTEGHRQAAAVHRYYA